MLACARLVKPLLLINSILIALGAQPLALRAYSFPLFASQYMTNRSPPTPFIIGSTTPTTALAAIAASTAEPPCSNTLTPAAEARVWLVATIPYLEIVIDRVSDRSSCACILAVKTSATQTAAVRELMFTSFSGFRIRQVDSVPGEKENRGPRG